MKNSSKQRSSIAGALFGVAVGDAVVYDWQDTGVGDCTGAGDHIGIITKPGATSFVVTEGNMTGGKTGTRTLQVNGRYIRGFITPDYAAIAKALGGAAIPTDTAPDATGKSIEEIAREVIAGKWGSGTDRRNRLQAAGYAYTTVQAKVNEILGKGTAQAGTAYTVGKDNEETFFNFCRQVLGLNVAGAVGATTNSAQRAYMLAKAHLQALRNQEAEIERAYIVAQGIHNGDGTIPDRVYCIDDMETFDRANEETAAEIESSGLWADILAAEEALKAAEDVMIAYGLSIAPADIRATLERGVKENYTIRLKVIDAVFHLDVSTVTGKGVTA